jgi:glyoxylase-like metal-dependent hydrolase (beta-lactamase superfamily II)
MSPDHRCVGRYNVTILHDGIFEAPSEVLTHVAGEQAREQAIAALGRPTIRIVVNCFALRDASGLTLVDAGTGTSWGDAYGHARRALSALGTTPDQVDRVLITHLHGDHALGLFDGDKPYFPKAEILVPEIDLAHFADAAKRAATPKARQSGFDIAATLLRLYDGRVRAAAPGSVMPGIELVPLPGHTHGHAGYLIADRARSLLLWGDALHLQSLQAADPDIGLVYDLDGETAARSRRTVLDRAAGEGWLVSGGHVEGIREVRRGAGGYEIVAASD